jgi:hypothetical protein
MDLSMDNGDCAQLWNLDGVDEEVPPPAEVQHVGEARVEEEANLPEHEDHGMG